MILYLVEPAGEVCYKTSASCGQVQYKHKHPQTAEQSPDVERKFVVVVYDTQLIDVLKNKYNPTRQTMWCCLYSQYSCCYTEVDNQPGNIDQRSYKRSR